MTTKLTYIDLFAGAGGLSEGFIRAGYSPVAHVEMDEAACYTLRTRTAFHYLKSQKKLNVYVDYLKGLISRETLYSHVPDAEMKKVIHMALSQENNKEIFKRIDEKLRDTKVDVVVGGPPCQAYSLVGRARSANSMKDDPRNYLYLQYAAFLKKYKPRLFVFENVLGLLSASAGDYYESMKKEFKKIVYDIKEHVLNAAAFGVLQNRKRVILIGHRKDLNLVIPDFVIQHIKSFHVKELLLDLPRLQAGMGSDKNGKYARGTNEYLSISYIRNGIEVLTQHVARPHTQQDKEIYQTAVDYLKKGERLDYTKLPERLKTHKNQHSFFDRFKVVDANAAAAQTVVAHIAKDGHYYIHPDSRQNRSLSVREAARLQSFPDDFYFEGVKEGKNRTAAFKQIGNAVPPLMAQVIATKLKKLI